MLRLRMIMITAPFSTPISPSEIPTHLCRQDTLLSIPKCNERERQIYLSGAKSWKQKIQTNTLLLAISLA